MGIKSNYKKIKYIVVILLLIFSCNTPKRQKFHKKDSMSVYQIDSLKYAQEISDFILEFDSIFYFDELGNLHAKLRVDSFLNSHINELIIVNYPDIAIDSQKIIEFFQCDRCPEKFAIRWKDFRFQDTLRRIHFIYGGNKCEFKSFVYEQIQYRHLIPIGGNPGEISQMLEELSKDKKLDSLIIIKK